MKLKTLLVAFAFLLLPMVFVHAEDGLTQCFDYYKFGSVQVDVTPRNHTTVSGTRLEFAGYVRNTNDYPIVDGMVYIKIFRKAAQSKVQSNGWELVDQYVAKKDIDIPGSRSYPLTFYWNVPTYAVAGDYKVATYFITQNRFNLSGLSFTDDITGNIVPFKVSSQYTKSVHFDRDSVKVAGGKYMFASFTPHMSPTEPVNITFNLKNDFVSAQNAQVKYTLYSWDGLQNEKIIDTKKEIVSVPANGIKTLTYTVTDTSVPVYYLVAESSIEGQKSIVNIRFAREGVEEARLNFPGISNYPLKKDNSVDMFACFHNSGLGDVVPNGKVVLTLEDGQGRTLDSFTYTTDIVKEMMAIKRTYIPTKDHANLTLIAQLYVDDKIVETSKTVYDCEALDKEMCSLESNQQAQDVSDLVMYILTFTIVLLLGVAVLAYRGHLKRKDVGVAMILFLTVVGVGMYQVNDHYAEAAIFISAETMPTLTEPENQYQGMYKYTPSVAGDQLAGSFLKKKHWVQSQGKVNSAPGPDTSPLLVSNVRTTARNFTQEEMWSSPEFFTDVWTSGNVVTGMNIDSFDFRYNYGAEIVDAVTGDVIPSGSSITIGTKIKIRNVAFDNTQLGWVLTGSTYDTPYAYWNTGSVPKCEAPDRFARNLIDNGQYFIYNIRQGQQSSYIVHNAEPTFVRYVTGFLPIVVNKPQVTINTDESTATLVKVGDVYTVTGPGTIKAKVLFSETSATAYYQYHLQDLLAYGRSQGVTYNTFSRYPTIRHISENNVEIPVTPITPAVIDALQPSACQSLAQHEFVLEPAEIEVNLNVGAQTNLPPNTPNFFITGSCVATPIQIRVAPATPLDPDTGDTITYEYQVDQGAGYGPILATGSTDIPVSFGSVGLKKIRIRAADNHGGKSEWVEKSVVINNCGSTLSCTDPSWTNDRPTWTATAFSRNPLITTSSYNWQWMSRSYSLSGSQGQTITSNNEVPAGSTWSGPTITAEFSNGSSQTLTCPPAVRVPDNRPSRIGGTCELDDFDHLYIPTWRANPTSGRAPYTYTWSRASEGEMDNNLFTLSEPLDLDESVDNLTVVIRDSQNQSSGAIACAPVSRTDEAAILLKLYGSTGIKENRLQIVQNQRAHSFASFGGVTNQCVYTGTLFNKFSPPLSAATGPAQLVNANIDTSTTGVFKLRAACASAGSGNMVSSNEVILEVTKQPVLQEI